MITDSLNSLTSLNSSTGGLPGVSGVPSGGGGLPPTTPRTSGAAAQNPDNPLFNVAKKIDDYVGDFGKIIWKPIDKILGLLKNSFKIVKELKPELQVKMDKAIGIIGLTSLISIILSLHDFGHDIVASINLANIKDYEGLFLKLTDLITTPVGILSDITTFVKGLVLLGSVPTIAFFSMIALPIALAYLSYNVARGIYELVRFIVEVFKMPAEVGEKENYDRLKAYLQDKVGEITVNTDECAAYSEMRRRTDNKIASRMRTLLCYLNKQPTNEIDKDAVNKELRDLKSLSWRKIGLKSVGLATNIAMTASLACALAIPVMSPLVIPIIGLIKGVISLVTTYVAEKYIESGLESKIITGTQIATTDLSSEKQ